MSDLLTLLFATNQRVAPPPRNSPHSTPCTRLFNPRLFPVQRVVIISASRAAAFFFCFPHFCFYFVGKYCPFWGNKIFVAKMKKSLQSRLLSHPAATPETELFLWTARDPGSQYGGSLLLSYHVGMLSERPLHVAHYDQTPWGSGEGLLPFRKNRPSVAPADCRRRR